MTELLADTETHTPLTETALPALHELVAGDVLTVFETQWFGGLELFPDNWPTNLRPSGKDFERLVLEQFTPDFFAEDPAFAEVAIAVGVLEHMPRMIERATFSGGEDGIKDFCLDVIPILETHYHNQNGEVDQQQAAQFITMNVGAYSRVLDHFGLPELTRGARQRLAFNIGDALSAKERDEREGPMLITKKPLKLGLDQAFHP